MLYEDEVFYGLKNFVDSILHSLTYFSSASASVMIAVAALAGSWAPCFLGVNAERGVLGTAHHCEAAS